MEQGPEISPEQQLNLKVNDILQNSEWEDIKAYQESRQMRERQIMLGESILHVAQGRSLESPDAILSVVQLLTTGEDGLPRISIAQWQVNSNRVDLNMVRDWPLIETTLDMAAKVVAHD